ncbi:MAG: exodeoxyribonuclease III [Rickettsiales bacterium]|nr:exodeoxyribonuclease III [Rickettsiales bacterium]
MKITTWNINSIKARLPNLLEFLQAEKPDVLLLQELKCVEEAFPFQEISDLGYNSAVFGQKTYNGVAILSKYKIEEFFKGLPNAKFSHQISEKSEAKIEGKKKPNFDLFDSSPQIFSDDFFESNSFAEKDKNIEIQDARYIEAVISVNGKVFRIASVYVPNGMDISSSKFTYKKEFFEALNEHLSNIRNLDEHIVIAGDFNVAMKNIDVFDAKSLEGGICFNIEEKVRFSKILNSGYFDLFRELNPEKSDFSWWDYRGNSWGFNKGMRIDYILANAKAADLCNNCVINSEYRGKEKASDHAPVTAVFEL